MLQAVEILKTAREIVMRVRYFPYSKFYSIIFIDLVLLRFFPEKKRVFSSLSVCLLLLVRLPETEGEDGTLGGRDILKTDWVDYWGTGEHVMRMWLPRCFLWLMLCSSFMFYQRYENITVYTLEIHKFFPQLMFC